MDDKLAAALVTLLAALFFYVAQELSKRGASKQVTKEFLKRDAEQAIKDKETEDAAERDRIASAKAFRDAFAEVKRDYDEERRVNARLDKRINDLVDLRTLDAGKIAMLEGDISRLENEARNTAATIQHLEEALGIRTTERDEAIDKIVKLNGEIDHRDKQIAQLTSDLEAASARIELLSERLTKIENRPDTGKLDPDKVPDVDPSLAQKAISAISDAQAETPLQEPKTDPTKE